MTISSFVSKFWRRGPALVAVAVSLLSLLAASPAAAKPIYLDGSGPWRRGTGGANAGDPVDVATGAFQLQEPLFRLGGRIPVSVSWRYAGLDASNGPLGVGTSLSTDYFIEPETVNGVSQWKLICPGNEHFSLPPTGAPGGFASKTDPELLGAVLSVTTSGGTMQSAILRWKTGEKFNFNNVGQLNKIEDRHGNWLSVVHVSTTGFPTSITQSGSGRSITFDYWNDTINPANPANGKVKSIGCGKGSYQFAYDTAGRLWKVTDALGGVTTYGWTNVTRSDGRVIAAISTVTDHNGKVRLTNDFDTQGRVYRQTFPDTGTINYTYSTNRTDVTDARGNVTRYDFAWTPSMTGYNLSSVTDPYGHSTTFERSGPSYLLTGVVDFLGRRVDLTWDHSRGNLLTATVPTASGGTHTWQVTYNTTWSRPLTITDPLNRQTVYTVDATDGDVTAVRNPRNYTTSFSIAANGDLQSVTDALNHTTSRVAGRRYRRPAPSEPYGRLSPHTAQASGTHPRVLGTRGQARTGFERALLSSSGWAARCRAAVSRPTLPVSAGYPRAARYWRRCPRYPCHSAA
jgi:hypothetical protein